MIYLREGLDQAARITWISSQSTITGSPGGRIEGAQCASNGKLGLQPRSGAVHMNLDGQPLTLELEFREYKRKLCLDKPRAARFV